MHTLKGGKRKEKKYYNVVLLLPQLGIPTFRILVGLGPPDSRHLMGLLDNPVILPQYPTPTPHELPVFPQ